MDGRAPFHVHSCGWLTASVIGTRCQNTHRRSFGWVGKRRHRRTLFCASECRIILCRVCGCPVLTGWVEGAKRRHLLRGVADAGEKDVGQARHALPERLRVQHRVAVMLHAVQSGGIAQVVAADKGSVQKVCPAEVGSGEMAVNEDGVVEEQARKVPATQIGVLDDFVAEVGGDQLVALVGDQVARPVDVFGLRGLQKQFFGVLVPDGQRRAVEGDGSKISGRHGGS